MNPYNPLNPFALAFALGIVAFILNGVALWRQSNTELVNKYWINSLLFSAFGGTIVLVGSEILLTTIAIDERNYGANGAFPHASLASYIASVVLVGAAGWAVYNAANRRQAIQVAAAVTGFFATSTVATYTIFLHNVRLEEWTLATTTCWFLTGASLIALAITTAVVKIRAYGVRQYERGHEIGYQLSAKAVTTV